MSTGKGRISASVRKVEFGRVLGKGRIRESVGKVEIWVSTGKGRIRASAGKVEIRVSTGKVGSRRVPKNGPGEYHKGGIRACTGKRGFGREPERWDQG